LRSNRARPTIIVGVVFTLVTAALAVAGGPGFRTHHLLEEHYAKHGREFGKVTQDQYLRMAQQLRDARPGKNILEVKRAGGISKFDKRYGWFGAYDSDGTIRTFFIPNDGLRYFERQARTHASPE
jgi:hypothetical protein